MRLNELDDGDEQRIMTADGATIRKELFNSKVLRPWWPIALHDCSTFVLMLAVTISPNCMQLMHRPPLTKVNPPWC